MKNMQLTRIFSDKSVATSSTQPTEQTRERFRWWIVLPIILVSMTTASTEPVLLNDIIVRRYQVVYGLVDDASPSTKTACNSESSSNDSSGAQLADQVQKSVSQLNIMMAGFGALPAVITYVLLGANSDRIGRRPLLILPCIGRIILFIILLLIVQCDLSDVWFIIANVFDGLFGSNSVLILGALAYISDCTTPDQRGRAMVLEEAAVALTRIFPLLGVGYWIQYHGYALPLSVNLGLNVAALIYIFVFQPESCGTNDRHIFYFFKQLKRIRLVPIRGTYRVFLTHRPGHNQRSIILLTLIQVFLYIVLFGFVNIQPLYFYGTPICFNAVDLAILTSYQFSIMIVISLILSIFFQRSYLMNSMLMPLIGTVTYMTHLVIVGAAQTVWLLYLALAIGCLFFVMMAVLRTQVTKLVNETEFALVLIATGIVETAGSYVIGILANQIYAETLEIYSGIIFFILAGFCLLPLALIGFFILSPYCSRPRVPTTPPVEEPPIDSPVMVTQF